MSKAIIIEEILPGQIIKSVIQPVNSQYPIIEESLPHSKTIIVQRIQHNATKREKPRILNSFEELDEIHQAIVNMRLMTIPYKTIADDIEKYFNRKYKEQSIRVMFLEGEICYEAFEYMQKERAKQRDIEIPRINEGLQQGALNSIGLLNKGLVDGTITPIQMVIANSMLDRAGYPRVSKTDVTGKYESDSMGDVADAMREIAAALKPTKRK